MQEGAAKEGFGKREKAPSGAWGRRAPQRLVGKRGIAGLGAVTSTEI